MTNNVNDCSIESLNFHDCKIYAVGFNNEKSEFLIDIDFINEWIESENEYMFRVFPCTLVFENAWNVEIDISTDIDLIIDSITCVNPRIPKNIDYLPPLTKEYDWSIELLQGQIQFTSIGFHAYQRGESKISKSQSLGLNERGGVSLDKSGIKVLHSKTFINDYVSQT